MLNGLWIAFDNLIRFPAPPEFFVIGNCILANGVVDIFLKKKSFS